MADAPGKDTPKTDLGSAGKTGPVKPPVLEGSARPVNESKPADKPAATKPEPAKTTPPPPKPKAEPAPTGGSGAAWAAGITGGVLGLAAAYGLAFFGLWPTPTPAPAPADPRIGQISTAIPELQTVTSTVQAELSTLNSRVSGLETSLAELPEPGPTVAAVDTSGLADQVDALSARLDELAAAPAPAAASQPVDLSQINADIASLRTALEALRQETAQSAARLEETETRITTLTDEAGAAATTGADLMRLPLIFSGLESAFAAGRPYGDALSALRQAQPDAQIPAALADRAAAGLPRPDDVARRTQALVPDMLASRPLSVDGDWQTATADWFRGVIAMRPADAQEGNTPEAAIARLEDAMARRDFAAAEAEIEALPEPMRNAAAPVAADIAALAAANAFLDELRAKALTQESAE